MLTASDLIAVGAVSFLAAYLGSYIRRKGENLATKEDIAAITRKEEEVRLEFAKTLQQLAHQNQLLIEQGTRRHQLRLAAVDTRLQKYQEAYSLWWELRSASRRKEAIGAVVMKCQAWWVNNSLYLDKDAREAFYRAYLVGGGLPDLLESASGQPGSSRDPNIMKLITESNETVDKAAEAIERGVELPSIRIWDEELGKALGGQKTDPAPR